MGLNAEVLKNILGFLGRVDMKGMEAFPFVAAYTAVQNELALAENPQLALALQAYQQCLAAQAPAPDSAASAYVPDDPPPFNLGAEG